MSFGFSVGDILLLVELSTKVVVQWKNACGEYNEVCREVSHVQYLLLRAERDASQSDSLLILDEADKEQWSRISEECTDILTNLNNQIAKRESLGTDRQRNWDKLRFNNSKLKDLRKKLASNRESITLFLNMIQTSSLGRVERQTADARTILLEMRDMMDHRASRMRAGKHQASIFSMGSSVTDDEKEIWKEFRRDLLNSGFRSEDVKINAAALRAHLRDLINTGQLDEQEPPQPHRAPEQPKTTQKPDNPTNRNHRAATVEDDEDDVSNDIYNDKSHTTTGFSAPSTSMSEKTYATREQQDSSSGPERDANQKLPKEEKRSWRNLWSRQPTSQTGDTPSELHTTKSQDSTKTAAAAHPNDPTPTGRHDSGYSTTSQENWTKAHTANTNRSDFNFYNEPYKLPENIAMPDFSSLYPSLAAIEWKRLPVNQIYPLKALPELPEGWDWRIDDQCRLFYVDTYAKGDEKRCFWRPPLPEPHSPTISTPGWERVETLFGRVYWVNEDTGRKTYVHPLGDREVIELSGIPYRFDYDLGNWLSLKKYDLQNLPCVGDDDSDVYCCLSDKVWNEGISRDAAIVRGDMHWGNHQAKGFAAIPSHRVVSKPSRTRNPFQKDEPPGMYVWGQKY